MPQNDPFAAYQAPTGDPFAAYQKPAEAPKSPAVIPQAKPWIGQPRPENEGTLSSIFHAPVYGVQDIGSGVKHLMESGKRMQGAHEIISGTGRAALPLVAPAIAAYGAGPVALAAGGSLLGSNIGSFGAEAFGASPEVSNLAGDVGGIVGGMGAPRIPFKAMGGKALDIMPGTDPAMRDAVGVLSPRAKNILGILQKAKDARSAYQDSNVQPISDDAKFGEAFTKLPPAAQDAIRQGANKISLPSASGGRAGSPPRDISHYGIESAPISKPSPVEAPALSRAEHPPFAKDQPFPKARKIREQSRQPPQEELGIHGGVENTPMKPLNTPAKLKAAQALKRALGE